MNNLRFFEDILPMELKPLDYATPPSPRSRGRLVLIVLITVIAILPVLAKFAYPVLVYFGVFDPAPIDGPIHL